MAATPNGLERVPLYVLIANIPLSLHLICQMLEVCLESDSLDEPSTYERWVPTPQQLEEDPPFTKWRMMNMGDAFKYAMDIIREEGDITEAFQALYHSKGMMFKWSPESYAAMGHWTSSDWSMTPVPLWEPAYKVSFFARLKLEETNRDKAREVHDKAMEDLRAWRDILRSASFDR